MKKVAFVTLFSTFVGILVALQVQENTLSKEAQVDVPGPIKQGVLGSAGVFFAIVIVFLVTQKDK